jgi:DNA-binding NarL/FixJ family response regulator
LRSSSSHEKGTHLGRRTIHILIVDADPADREACRRAIAECPDREAVFAEATSAEEALHLCRAEDPDCIVLDYRLPDRDGLQLIRALQDQEGALAPVPVVMLGNWGQSPISAWGAAAAKRL